MPHLNTGPGEIDFVTGYFPVFKNKVLLVHHKRLGMWACGGGHIELTEDPNESLLREVEEDFGWKPDEVEIVSVREEALDRPGFKSLFPPAYLNIHRVNAEGHRHVSLAYFLKVTTDMARLNDREHASMRWFSEEELDDPQYDLPPEICFYAKEAIRRLGS